MKLNIGDIVTVVESGVSLTVAVEDASKGDIIQAKVQSSDVDNPKYEIGKVYSFSRNDIKQDS